MKRLGIVLFLCALLSACSIFAQAAPLAADFSIPCDAAARAIELEKTSLARGIPQEAERILAFAAANTDGAPSGSDVTAAWRSLEDGIVLRDALGARYRAFLGYETLCRAVYGGIAAGDAVFFPIADGYACAQTAEGSGCSIFAAPGTPIVAVESGCIEAVGKNSILLRSDDGLRRYCYTNLLPDAAAHIGAGEVLGTAASAPLHITLEATPPQGRAAAVDAHQFLLLLSDSRSAVIQGCEACWMRIGA